MSTDSYIVLSAILFTIGTVGFMIRRNAIMKLMCVELMLNATNLALKWRSRECGALDGQVAAFFVMVVAAAEVVVGLAIIVTIFHAAARPRSTAANLLKFLKDCDAPTRGRDACAGNRFLHPGLAADRHACRELR